MTEMQPLQAVFTSQEQAEEAIRKLASLRADRFRMERPVRGAIQASAAAPGAVSASAAPDAASAASAAPTAAATGGQAPMSRLAQSLLADTQLEAGEELGGAIAGPETEPAFHLTVQVPAAALERAKKVIALAGGTTE